MFDTIVFAFRNIRERKVRSILTILGIAIGIAALVALFSIAQGLNEEITSQLSGSMDIIVVSPAMAGVTSDNFTKKDLTDVKNINGVESVTEQTIWYTNVEYAGRNKMMMINGIDPVEYEKIFPMSLSSGRMLRETDRNACIIGPNVSTVLGTPVRLNSTLKVNGVNYSVVGILGEQNEDTANIFSPALSSSILISNNEAKALFGENIPSQLFVKIEDPEKASIISKEIETTINQNHRSENFAMVTSISDVQRIYNVIIGTLELFLGAIMSISLIVAAIGITNTMFMSIMERTHEVGVMKAVGAKNSDILKLFLAETSLLSGIGGAVGSLLGIAAAKIVSVVLPLIGGETVGEVPIAIDPLVILAGIVVAIVVGILAGLYPARRASKMSPAEAVRYE